MGQVLVRYKVKPDQVQANEDAVRAVYTALQHLAPVGFRYGTLKLDDGLTFVHIASIETPDGTNPLPGLQAFQDFQAGLKDRCAEPPAPMQGTIVGSYGIFD